jgi:hypothetical protein
MLALGGKLRFKKDFCKNFIFDVDSWRLVGEHFLVE